MYLAKSLNSSKVGRKVIILQLGFLALAGGTGGGKRGSGTSAPVTGSVATAGAVGGIGVRFGAPSCSEVTTASGVSAIAGSWVGTWSWDEFELRGGGNGGMGSGGEAGAGAEAGAGGGTSTVSMGVSVAIRESFNLQVNLEEDHRQ